MIFRQDEEVLFFGSANYFVLFKRCPRDCFKLFFEIIVAIFLPVVVQKNCCFVVYYDVPKIVDLI